MHQLLNSRRLLFVIALAVGCGFPAIRVGAAVARPRPNILFLFADDQRPDGHPNEGVVLGFLRLGHDGPLTNQSDCGPD